MKEFIEQLNKFGKSYIEGTSNGKIKNYKAFSEDYFPLFNFGKCRILHHTPEGEKYWVYQKDTVYRHIYYYSPRTFLQGLYNFALTKRKFKVREKNFYIHLGKGMIEDMYGNPLLVIAIKAFKTFKTDNLKIFINQTFIQNPIYKNIYKNAIKTLIEPCISLGIKIEYVSLYELKQELFTPLGEDLQASSLTDTKRDIKAFAIDSLLDFRFNIINEEITREEEEEEF